MGIKAGKATITNSIVYFNTIGEIRTELAPKVALTYSCVRAGVIPGGNPTNLNLNPQFQSSIDWHLQPTSPVINAGTNTLRPPAVLLTTDLDGKPRVMGTSVDMGAYEFQ